MLADITFFGKAMSLRAIRLITAYNQLKTNKLFLEQLLRCSRGRFVSFGEYIRDPIHPGGWCLLSIEPAPTQNGDASVFAYHLSGWWWRHLGSQWVRRTDYAHGLSIVSQAQATAGANEKAFAAHVPGAPSLSQSMLSMQKSSIAFQELSWYPK